jgi:uncharacterized phage protein (TIGR01671 family)
MMREILFRGKRLDNGEWVEGNAFIPRPSLGGETCIVVQDALFHSFCYEVNLETVGQFTGLTDKNGKKIFEGDIVHCTSWTDTANMVVIFENGEFRMVLCERFKEYIPDCGFYAIRCYAKEVIGNIHDNPELLEVDNG